MFVWRLLHSPLEILYMGAYPGGGACLGHYGISSVYVCVCVYYVYMGVCVCTCVHVYMCLHIYLLAVAKFNRQIACYQRGMGDHRIDQ